MICFVLIAANTGFIRDGSGWPACRICPKAARHNVMKQWFDDGEMGFKG